MRKCCELNFTIEEVSLNFDLKENQGLEFEFDSEYVVGGGGSYTPLTNKPQINYVTLIGNKNSEELGLEPTIIDITEQDIDKIIFGG